MNRGAILRALYVVMLGNPRLRNGSNLDSAETRFKEWHHLIGSAVENGAKLCAERDENASAISFKDMFFKIRTGEEQATGRAVLLTILIATWPKGFSSSELSGFLDDYSFSTSNDDDAAKARVELRAALAQTAGSRVKNTSSTALTWKLKTVVDTPVGVDGKILVLRYYPEKGHGGTFQVEEIGGL